MVPFNGSVKIGSKLWVGACGNPRGKIMVIAPFPETTALRAGSASRGRAWFSVLEAFGTAGLPTDDIYLTYLTKYNPGTKKSTVKDISTCREELQDEIRNLKPDIVVMLGADVWTGMDMDKVINFSDIVEIAVKAPIVRNYTEVEMQHIPAKGKSPAKIKEVKVKKQDIIDNVLILPLFNPEYLDITPKETDGVIRAVRSIPEVIKNGPPKLYKPEYDNITTVAEMQGLVDAVDSLLTTGPGIAVALDCEWEGSEWYKDNIRLRTIQMCIDGRFTFNVILTRVDKDNVIYDVPDNRDEVLSLLSRVLTHPKVEIVGHNVKEDTQWLYACTGIDIRDRVKYDTMLAETLINQNGPFGLEDMALKYTDVGRWFIPLAKWRKTAPPLLKNNGFGYIPDDILEPYAATDAIVTYRIMEEQLGLLVKLGYTRSVVKDDPTSPSLLDITMRTQDGLVEVERTGLPVDRDMLNHMIQLFEAKHEIMRADLVRTGEDYIVAYEAKKTGKDPEELREFRRKKKKTFNPGSSKQLQYLLFTVLGITPFKATQGSGGQLWHRAISKLSLDDEDALDKIAAATDMLSLTILQDNHPILPKLLDFNRIDQVVKTWLCTPKENIHGDLEGGLIGNLGADGALHPTFRMGLNTGRLATSSPNSQNFPKRANKALEDLFKFELENNSWLLSQGGKLPMIRNLVVPPPGYVIIEGDFIQAELFVLAGISGDASMWKALTTPGLDLHDAVALSAFNLTMESAAEPGVLLTEDDLVSLAAFFGAKSPEYEKIMNSLTYIASNGRRMTRKEFKDTVRVSAKSVNFGIPYGRGANAIAQQIKAETGSKLPLSQLESEVADTITAWKEEMYPSAWRYMSRCSYNAQNNWEVVNPWGRSRRFIPTTNEKLLSEYGRQGSNFPIQSTVADTCNIALFRMIQERAVRGIDFRVCNLVHDAIMVFVKEEQVDSMKQLYQDTMGSVEIPLENRKPLVLGIDLEVMTRWGKAA